MVDQDIYGRTGINPANVIRQLQAGTLRSLFTGSRMERMAEDEAINGANAYTMADLFDDTRSSIFSELQSGVDVDQYRRTLHRLYIDQMGSIMMSDDNTTDAKALARGTLSRLQDDLEKAAKRADGMKEHHYKDLLARIEMIQEGKMPGANGNGRAQAIDEAAEYNEFNCWENDLSWIWEN
jgi:GMP synthase PP-ATPase subunit